MLSLDTCIIVASVIGTTLSQVAYSIIDTRPERKMIAWCLQHNVQLLAYGYVASCIFMEHAPAYSNKLWLSNPFTYVLQAKMCFPKTGNAMILDSMCRTLLGGFLSEKYLGRPEPKRPDLTTSSLSKYKYVIDQWGGWALFQVCLHIILIRKFLDFKI